MSLILNQVFYLSRNYIILIYLRKTKSIKGSPLFFINVQPPVFLHHLQMIIYICALTSFKINIQLTSETINRSPLIFYAAFLYTLQQAWITNLILLGLKTEVEMADKVRIKKEDDLNHLDRDRDTWKKSRRSISPAGRDLAGSPPRKLRRSRSFSPDDPISRDRYRRLIPILFLFIIFLFLKLT